MSEIHRAYEEGRRDVRRGEITEPITQDEAHTMFPRLSHTEREAYCRGVADGLKEVEA